MAGLLRDKDTTPQALDRRLAVCHDGCWPRVRARAIPGVPPVASHLIKVPTEKGPIWVGVGSIIAVLVGDSPGTSTILLRDFPSDGLKAQCSAQAIATLANGG